MTVAELIEKLKAMPQDARREVLQAFCRFEDCVDYVADDPSHHHQHNDE